MANLVEEILLLREAIQRLDREAIFSKSYTTTANITAGTASTERFISQVDEDTNAPFDTIVIVNNDNVALGIRLDQNPENVVPVAAGGAVATDVVNFRSFSIENQDSANDHTAGLVKILVQKTRKHLRPQGVF